MENVDDSSVDGVQDILSACTVVHKMIIYFRSLKSIVDFLQIDFGYARKLNFSTGI